MPADLRSQFFQALINAWGFVLHLAPYLVSGIVLAAALATFVRFEKPARLLRSGKWWMLPGAGLAGLVSPACTYGTVPVFVEMIRRGAPAAPAAAFLVASSLVNPQMFLLTAGALGVKIALAQAGASLAFAVGIGWLASRAATRDIDLMSSELTRAETDESEATQVHRSPDHRAHRHSVIAATPWPRRLAGHTLDLLEFVGFYFLVGTLIASLAAEFVPQSVVMAAVGEGRWWAIPCAAVVSVPTYICGGGTIPFLAQASRMGMSMGAVLAFLIAGPATRITALSALAVIFKKRLVLVYFVLLLVFASALGFALGHFVAVEPAAGPYGVRF